MVFEVILADVLSQSVVLIADEQVFVFGKSSSLIIYAALSIGLAVQYFLSACVIAYMFVHFELFLAIVLQP